MTQQRRRVWAPFSTGDDPTLLGIQGDLRIFVPSLLEIAAARNYRQYTVQRMLLSGMLIPTTAFVTVAVGLRFDNVDSIVGTVDPENDKTSDWLYLEEFCTNAISDTFHWNRDIRAQRKSRGNDEELFLYVTNRSTASSINLHVSGRVLILLS